MINLIVCTDSAGGIGKDGALPWAREFSDLPHFRGVNEDVPDLSVSNTLIMGRKTWESLPRRPLDDLNRSFIIVSRDRFWMCPIVEENGETHLITHLSEAIELALGGQARDPREKIFIVGGGEVYRQCIENDWVDRVIHTEIDRRYDCDTFFHLPENWRLRSFSTYADDPRVGATISIYTKETP